MKRKHFTQSQIREALRTLVPPDASGREADFSGSHKIQYDIIKNILNGQYALILNPRTEIRTRTVTKWHWVTKSREVEKVGFRWEGGRLVPYTYTDWEEYRVYESYQEEEEYEYKILDVSLSRQSIGSYVLQRGLSDDELGRYQLLLETKGNKPDVFD